MKLQLAIDVLKTDEAVHLANLTAKYIDIIEIGTPLIKHEGIYVLKKLKQHFPDKEILVDLKTMDVGEYESDFCFDNGADIVTVLGAADIETIKGSIKSAKKHDKKVMVDLINVQEKLKVAERAEKAGCDFIGIHTGIDQQHKNQTPLNDLINISKSIKIPIVVAGGINESTIDLIVAHNPAVVVVGGAITSSDNPEIVAKRIKERINNYVTANLEYNNRQANETN